MEPLKDAIIDCYFLALGFKGKHLDAESRNNLMKTISEGYNNPPILEHVIDLSKNGLTPDADFRTIMEILEAETDPDSKDTLLQVLKNSRKIETANTCLSVFGMDHPKLRGHISCGELTIRKSFLRFIGVKEDRELFELWWSVGLDMNFPEWLAEAIPPDDIETEALIKFFASHPPTNPSQLSCLCLFSVLKKSISSCPVNPSEFTLNTALNLAFGTPKIRSLTREQRSNFLKESGKYTFLADLIVKYDDISELLLNVFLYLDRESKLLFISWLSEDYQTVLLSKVLNIPRTADDIKQFYAILLERTDIKKELYDLPVHESRLFIGKDKWFQASGLVKDQYRGANLADYLIYTELVESPNTNDGKQ